MMNKFREFFGFIYETTSYRLPKLEESFEDVFIYVPNDEILPISGNTSSAGSRISLKKYFAKWNKDFYNLVYNRDWEVLESVIGYEFLRFCLVECIFAKKTKAGGFMVSHLPGLRDKLTTNEPEKLNKIFYKSASLDKYGRENVNNEVQRNLMHLFNPSDLGISCDNCLFKTSKTNRFPKDHILMAKNNDISMSKQVTQICAGNRKISGHENCLEQLEKILQELKRNHAKYNYEKSLDRLLLSRSLQTKNEKKNKSLAKQLPIPVLKQYFANICSYVIPVELFGTNKNLNAMIKIICNLLDAPYRQTIFLRPYMVKIRLSDIHWLNKAINSNVQWILLGKLLKWLFVTYILEIFRTQFYIMVTTTSQKVYFKQLEWQRSTTAFVRKMCKDKMIENVNGLIVDGPCVGKWMLFPKKNGLRPIMSRIKGSKINEITKQTLRYLQQLYTTKYGDFRKTVFIQRWKDLVAKYHKGDKKPVYIVSCDVESAYESIDQKKLMRIVESLANLNGPQLKLKLYKIAKNLKVVKSLPIAAKRYVNYPELELPVTEGAVFACVSGNTQIVEKETLLREMRSNIRNQNILVRNQRYVLTKGIAQGAVLSSILCDMYYAHMIEAKLSRFKNQGFLYRYVDDFLFVTEDKALAEEFLDIIKTGFPDYNCTFATAKTRTNLPGLRNTQKNITFLGYNINLGNLEVTLDYSKNSRYTTVASRPLYDIVIKFRTRLCNLASLKLDGLVLDLKVNSEDTFVRTVECAFIRQAERCLWLLRSMFDDIHGDLPAILKIIRSNNIQIFRRVKRYSIVSGYDFEKLVPRLAVIPWKSYRQVFGKMQSIHKPFRTVFLKNIKMTSKTLTNC